MIPKRIELENFLSFGSPATEIVFTDDEPLWVIGGPNGVGKSAVFDAMTYALFAEHRGGAQDHGSLVRHGANGFRVVFEFEFNDTDYRITRNRPLSGRPTHSVERRSADSWVALDLPAVAGRQDPVKTWSERTLGVGFDAFAASVLLRQGEADAIISARPAERLAILKKIIGIERYEGLSNSVHQKTNWWKERLDDRRTRLNGLTEVTDAQVKAGQEEYNRTEEAQSAAQAASFAAAERVPRAKEWNRLETNRQELEQNIRDATALLDHADGICAKHTRLNDLMAAVPVLRQIIALRGRLSDAPDALSKLRDEEKRLAEEVDRLTTAAEQEKQKAESYRRQADDHEGKAKELRKEIKEKAKLVPMADEAAKLKANLAAFPPDLADRLAEARKKAHSAAEDFTARSQNKARIAGLLEPAKEQQQRFNTVGVGVLCPQCGQFVSEEHAERERARLGKEVRELERKLDDAKTSEQEADDAKRAAEEKRDALNDHHQEQLAKSQRLADLERTLAELGVTTDADELRSLIAGMSRDADHHEREARTQAEARQLALGQARRLDKERGELAERLLTGLDTERQRLDEAGIADDFRQLVEAATRRDQWRKELDKVKKAIDDIPQNCRVPVADADRDTKLAKEAADQARRNCDTAKERYDTLSKQAQAYRALTAEVADAKRQADLHGKLDDLLGKRGIQLALVRSAEREIVRLAKDTVQNLSDGDLTIELDDSADGGDEAFALRFRRGDNPTPIGVAYLSGSEKFRVAVSVALAIGQFATGQARPLESVIIDEGFGSLDPNGLRATADELNRLRQHLRRIVLVSHQDDFADRFPIVIKLTPGENGTIVESFRR